MTRIPGPTTWVPGGHFLAFRRDPLTFFTTTARTYGDIARWSFGSQPVYLVSHPDWIEDVLVTSAKKFMKGIALQRAKRLLGEGLLTSEGQMHLRQRRTIQPLFHKQQVQRFAESMVRHAIGWRGNVQDGSIIDVTAEMGALTLAIVGDTLFSSNVQADAAEVREALHDAVQSFAYAVLPRVELLERLPIGPFVKVRKARARLDRIILRVIAARRAEIDTPEGVSPHDRGSSAPHDRGSSAPRDTPEGVSPHGRSSPPHGRSSPPHDGSSPAPASADLVTMLLAARDPEHPAEPGMSDQQIRDEAMTIFLAGHETTANAMAWTWHLLGSHPQAAAALHDENDRVIGARPPLVADVPKLEYTRAVIAESMRLFPPAWTMGRRAIEPHTIGGYEVERDALVLMSQWVVHRDPRWWSDAASFRPERWLGDPGSRPKYAYFPFGGGNRVCIGESFAWTEAVLLLATIAQHWTFAHVTQPTPEPRITLRPANLRMRAQRRTTPMAHRSVTTPAR